jgi:hypothetical protein
MAINTVNDYAASAKQICPFTKTASITTVGAARSTQFASAGNPGAGTAAFTTALTGVVPTDATAGFPLLNAFGGSAAGYLTRVAYSLSVAGRLELWDTLWGINVPTTPAAPTTYTMSGASSYLGRCPSGHGVGARIFLWATTAVAASAVTITVNYTNSGGTSGRSTGASASLASLIVGRWIELPLQAGDSGVDSVQSVVVGGTAAATGAINVVIVRPLWTARVNLANGGDVHGLDKTGMPVVYADSAIMLTTVPDGTAAGIPDLLFEVANA